MPKKTAATATPAKDSKTADATQKKGAKKGIKTKTLKEIKKLPVFDKRPRNYGIGGDIQPKRDLSRFVKWPRYVRVQRQRRILSQRLKVPPTINQFSKTVDKATAVQLFKFLNKYRPETKKAKKQRLLKVAADQAKNQSVDLKAPLAVKYGFNNVVGAIESKKAKLVVIAHDVNPIELVVYIPTLCKKMNIPYCIVKSKSRLGTLVYRKSCTSVAIIDVNKDDKNELVNLQSIFTESFNKNLELRKQWGGGRLPNKHNEAKRKREKAIAKELAAKQKK